MENTINTNITTMDVLDYIRRCEDFSEIFRISHMIDIRIREYIIKEKNKVENYLKNQVADPE